MKSTFRKRIVAALTTLGVLSSIVIGADIGNTIESKQLEVYAFESENSSHVTTAYIEVENAMFPMQGNVYLTQTAFEKASHENSNAMDVWSDDTYFRAPFSGSIVNYKPDAGYCNEFIFQSSSRVRWADDRLDKMSVFVLHSEDDAEISKLLNVHLNQGDAIVTQGQASGRGKADRKNYGIHLDIQIASGNKVFFANRAHLNGEVLHYNAFFVDSKTVLHATKNRALGIPEDKDPYRGKWVENNAFKFIESTTSSLKVTCPNSLAFEEEYSLSDLLFGDVIFEQALKLDTINRIVNTYTSLDYDTLNDFEKHIFDSCTYEWVDSLSTENSTEENNVKAEAIVEVTETPTELSTESEARPEYTIKFDANGGRCDVQEINLTWGVCSNEPFPTPEKFGSVFQGWFDIAGNEYTNNSIFDSNMTLYAKWYQFPELLFPETTTIVITQTAKVYADPNIIQTEPPTTYTTTVPAEITAESISLSRSQIMLNTAGKSRTYQLHSTINPTNVTDTYVSWSSSDPTVAVVDAGLVVAKSDGSATITAKTKNGKTAICTVTVKTSYDKIKGEWSEYSTTPISEAANIEIDTEILPVSVLRWIVTDSYTTRTWERERQFRNFSINPRDYGLDTGYGQNAMSSKNMFGVYLTFSPEEFEKFRVIKPGEWSSGNQSGQNMGTENGYEYIDGYIVFIKERIYEDIPMTHYRYRTVTEVPTVFVN